MDHGLGNLVPVIIWGLFMVAAARRMFRRRPPPMPTPAENASPAGAPAALPRRRLAPAPAPRPAPRPIVAQVFPPATRATINASMAETLPAEAAAAFPGLDLLLPGSSDLAVVAPRRRIRTIGGGAPLGSPGWAANAVVAMEVLGPPVSLRSGATLGAPHAF
jgi:hypothetical protein